MDKRLVTSNRASVFTDATSSPVSSSVVPSTSAVRVVDRTVALSAVMSIVSRTLVTMELAVVCMDSADELQDETEAMDTEPAVTDSPPSTLATASPVWATSRSCPRITHS